ncbi:BCCT family transporter [Halofilum ochraceum]|uniref:BCCT family transporter n=1 Tax=Halofilum ochraceum TaxID=1611323 RepID=UPI0008D8E7F8|nr:BCCT family transporter [Halofilum ochraceum]
MSDTDNGCTGGHGLLIVAAALIGGLILFAAAKAQLAGTIFEQARVAVAAGTGWLLILIMNVVLGFAFFLALSRYGGIRLGGPDARPEYSRLDWFGMLFAAGMGIGLLFYSIAEPLQHFAAFLPYLGDDRPATARLAMEMTFLHWGLHPWAVYALVGLSLAFFHFNRGEPLGFGVPLARLMRAEQARRVGWAVNLVAVLSTVFGISTSLGLGTSQAAEGIGQLTGLPASTGLELALIGIVASVALVSVLSGLGNGVRLLSKLNLLLAFALMLYVLFAGQTVFVLKALGEHVGGYLNDLTLLSTWNETYTGTNWQAQWTLFYWSWWIAWSPFVGMFIAKVSRGRTVREYILGVVLVPSGFNFLWMTVFGGNALHLELFQSAGLAEAVAAEPDASLYTFLAHLPWSEVTIALAVVVVLIFFVTSADSGAHVVATLTSNGLDPSWQQRVFWVVTVALVAAVLMRAGGLSALQSATIATGLPFGLLLLAMIPALLRAMRADPRDQQNSRS